MPSPYTWHRQIKVAQFVGLRLPSCGLGFESQAHCPFFISFHSPAINKEMHFLCIDLTPCTDKFSQLSVFVCAYHPAVLGSNPKHIIHSLFHFFHQPEKPLECIHLTPWEKNNFVSGWPKQKFNFNDVRTATIDTTNELICNCMSICKQVPR